MNRDPFIHATHGSTRVLRQRAHDGPAFTLYPSRPTSGWAYLAGAVVLGAAVVGLLLL